MAVIQKSDDTWKIAALLASTTDVPINSVLPIIDGVQTQHGNRILLKDQTDPTENGIYVVQSMTLAKDSDNNVAWAFVNGGIVRVLGGSTNVNTEWYIAPIAAVDYAAADKLFIPSPFTSSYTPAPDIATGPGTTNVLAKWTDGPASVLGVSMISDDGVDVTVSTLSGTGDRLVEATNAGVVKATKTIINTYGVPNNEKLKLENSLNWDANGVYTGAAIVNTYQGQKHYDDNYFYEVVADNTFIRLIRG